MVLATDEEPIYIKQPQPKLIASIGLAWLWSQYLGLGELKFQFWLNSYE